MPLPFPSPWCTHFGFSGAHWVSPPLWARLCLAVLSSLTFIIFIICILFALEILLCAFSHMQLLWLWACPQLVEARKLRPSRVWCHHRERCHYRITIGPVFTHCPKGQRLKKFKIAVRDWNFQARLKISIPDTRETPSLCGELWRSRLKISSEIEVFNRDWNFQARLIFFNLWALRVLSGPKIIADPERCFQE